MQIALYLRNKHQIQFFLLSNSTLLEHQANDSSIFVDNCVEDLNAIPYLSSLSHTKFHS